MMRGRDVCIISLFSLTIHLLALGVFSVSFRKECGGEYPYVFFGAGLLEPGDLEIPVLNTRRRKSIPAAKLKFRRPFPPGGAETRLLRERDPAAAIFKPAALPAGRMKMHFSLPVQGKIFPVGESASLFMYPLLPGYFPLYFKDRENAHIGLSFRITAVTAEGKDYIEIKRKISCGNPEVDLIALRQVECYLLLQRRYFQPGRWHDVNIDFSPRYDNH